MQAQHHGGSSVHRVISDASLAQRGEDSKHITGALIHIIKRGRFNTSKIDSSVSQNERGEWFNTSHWPLPHDNHLYPLMLTWVAIYVLKLLRRWVRGCVTTRTPASRGGCPRLQCSTNQGCWSGKGSGCPCVGQGRWGPPYPQHSTHWGHRLGWREVPARTPAVMGRMPTHRPLGTQAEKQRRPPMGSTEVKQRVQEREALPKNDFRR